MADLRSQGISEEMEEHYHLGTLFFHVEALIGERVDAYGREETIAKIKAAKAAYEAARKAASERTQKALDESLRKLKEMEL